MARARRGWFWLTGGGVAAIFVALLLARRSDRHIEPVPPNPFVRALAVSRTDDGHVLEDVVELPFQTGFYADVAVVPAETIPESLDGKEVEKPDNWPLALVIYPLGGSADSEDALVEACLPYKAGARFRKRPNSESAASPTPPVPLGTTGHWRLNQGYKRDPEPPQDWREGEIRLWTFVAIGDHEPGEYVYELIVHPAARWTSSVRFDLGPRVVLKRGLLRVTTGDPDAAT